jgi:hypothetical protein
VTHMVTRDLGFSLDSPVVIRHEGVWAGMPAAL